jgi:hypothetical protein
MVRGGAGLDVAAYLRFRLDTGGCRLCCSSRSGRARNRSGEARRNDRRTNCRARSFRWRLHNRRRGRRRSAQSRLRIDHRRHRRRTPIQPQQHAAERNNQHEAVDRNSHRFALRLTIPILRTARRLWNGDAPIPSRGPSYVKAFFTRSAVIGVSRNLTPVNAANALLMAGATSGVAICPAPVGGLFVDTTSMCICGISFIRMT